LKAAQILLKHGEQGRVINLLNSEPVLSDVGVRGLAADLGGIALAQLRLAGRSSVSGPVGETERADVIGVRSVLAQDRGLLAVTAGPAPRGIAIVVSSLGAGGAQKQVVELVRQICSSPCEHLGAVFLLLVSRSSSEPEFHASKLAGLGVTTEFMSDFDFDVEGLVPAGVAAKLGALSPNNFNQTVWLVDRLKALGPQAVLVMSDLIGLPAMLAAFPRWSAASRHQRSQCPTADPQAVGQPPEACLPSRPRSRPHFAGDQLFGDGPGLCRMAGEALGACRGDLQRR
jgi:hypothetical protein